MNYIEFFLKTSLKVHYSIEGPLLHQLVIFFGAQFSILIIYIENKLCKVIDALGKYCSVTYKHSIFIFIHLVSGQKVGYFVGLVKWASGPQVMSESLMIALSKGNN